MKRLAFLILLFLAAAGARAQEMSVASMVQSAMDLSAATHPRTDLNGVTCALVKVLMPAGAEFEGNVMGAVEFRTGEYWVYLTSGTKQLRVKHVSAKPLQVMFADYGIARLESKATYTLDITMPSTAAPAQSVASGRNYAVFTVDPPTATVTIDGAVHEPRSGKVRVLLRQGAYDYTVDAPGYLPEQGRVTIGTTKAELSARLRLNIGTLSVSSTTAGTEIYVNGEKMGTGTWSGNLAPGEYTIEGRRADYASVKQTAVVSFGQTTDVALPALSYTKGTLSVSSATAGTEIYVNGEKMGTDTWRGDVAPGEYLVEGRRAGFTSAKQDAVVSAEQITEVGIPALLYTKGTLAVTSATAGTEIYVNGEMMGTDAWRGDLAPGEYIVEGRLASHRPVEQLATLVMGEKSAVALPALSPITGSLNVDFEPDDAIITIDGVARGTAPAMIEGVLSGTHSVTISAKGYTAQTHTVTIADSETTTLSGSLSKIVAKPFSLCAVAPNGSVVYFTADEWRAIPVAKQKRYKKIGVLLADKGDVFIVELGDKDGGKKMGWQNATSYNLPTKEQGEILAKNKTALNNALITFGGIVMDKWYWTKTEAEYSNAYAWYVNMNTSYVGKYIKTYEMRVRAVAPIPAAAK